MTPGQQQVYDAVVNFLTALSIVILVAIGLTISFNLATPITRLEPVSPFAVFGLIAFLDLVCFEAKNLWGYFRR